jgi:hypothetical protein
VLAAELRSREEEVEGLRQRHAEMLLDPFIQVGSGLEDRDTAVGKGSVRCAVCVVRVWYAVCSVQCSSLLASHKPGGGDAMVCCTHHGIAVTRECPHC